jgi:hypothetical protein
MWQTRVTRSLGAVCACFDRNPRLMAAGGALAALLLALWHTAPFVRFSPETAQIELSRPADIHHLYRAAQNARWSDIPGWWVGPWNYPGFEFYRPLTSTLFFLQQRAFDLNFTAYNLLTWLAHSLNAALLYALCLSLFQHRKKASILFAMIAVYFFTTPAGLFFFSVERSVAWWPAQNDVFGLTSGLLCLLLLDRHLQQPDRRSAVGALLCFAVSLCFKEMGYILTPLAVALIWHRRCRVTRLTWAFAALGGGFWLFRSLVLTHPAELPMWRASVLQKLLLSWGGPVYLEMRTGNLWVVAAAAMVLAVCAFGLWRRWRGGWIAVISAGIVAACAQWLDSGEAGWVQLLEPQTLARVYGMLLYLLGITLLARYRRQEPGLWIGGCYLLVFLPILPYSNLHYHYWSGAFYGMVVAVFCACLGHLAQEIRALHLQGARVSERDSAAALRPAAQGLNTMERASPR